NPPYNSAALQASRDAAKAAAHMGNVFGPWARAAARVLRTGGTATFIFRPRDVAAALGAFEGRFGGVTLRPVHPRVGEPASRLLMRGVRGSKAPLAMLPPLVLHEADGAFTPASDAILRGKTGIVMHL
ncbi:MAG: methyltransferase, partial [Pseudomonadota bacterium]